MAKKCFFSILTVIAFSVCQVLASTGSKVVLVSFDGFRYDYLEDVDTPNFDAAIANGVTAPYMTPAFVTLTLPSHFSIVTGLWPESHGVVHNIMYDPVFNETITAETRNQSKWWDMGAEPIWQTARLQGKKSGSHFYFGEDVEIMGLYPNVYIGNRDEDVPTWNERVDTVVSWLLNDDADVVTMYFDEPDGVGHYDGVDSEERRAMVRKCDDTLGYLQQQLDEGGLADTVNIVVVSDHGMSDIFDDMKVELYDHIDPNDAYHVIADYGPVAMIQPVEGKLDTIFQNLRNAHPNMSVYLKEDIPERLHYRDHYRILPIFAITDRPWEIATRWEPNGQVGGHGFDNQEMVMKNIFVATGPDFKRGYTSEPFNSVDIYPLLCQILQLEPAPNNGSMEIVKQLLASDVDAAASLTANFWKAFLCLFFCLNVIYNV